MHRLLTRPAEAHKAKQGLAQGVGQAICYLEPRDAAFHHLPPSARPSFCPRATPECFAHCLVGSGQLRFERNRRIRVWRSRLLAERPLVFGALLELEIAEHVAWCRARGLQPAFRFNGTSDYPFESWELPHLGRTIHRHLLETAPEALVGEYTKREDVMFRWLRGELAPNLHLTFSESDRNRADVLRVLAQGGNVASVFRVKRGEPLPASHLDRPVLDGDEDDLRWRDAERLEALGLAGPAVIGLRGKGSLERKGNRSPFALPVLAAG